MTLIIHTDASTKNGWSTYCFKVVGEDKCHVGYRQSSNCSAMEVLAIIKAVEYAVKYYDEHMYIISDSLTSIRLLQTHSKRKTTATEYNRYRNQLVGIYKKYRYGISATWISSESNDRYHVEVDHVAKVTLNELLKTKGKP